MKKKLLFAIIIITVFIIAVIILNPVDTRREKGGKLNIITTLFPLYDFTRTISADKAEVTLLIPPGVEPHSFEPRPSDLAKINNAEIFIYTLDAMEPWADKVIRGAGSAKLAVVEAGKEIALMTGKDEQEHRKEEDEHQYSGKDPHIWLDFGNARKMVDIIAAAIVKADSGNKGFYISNANAYKKRLSILDAEFRNGLGKCQKRYFIQAGHSAFSYLARRYNLDTVALQGFSPDSEPTPKKMIELAKFIKQKKIKYIFFEELVSPKLGETLSKETGAKLLFLNAAHNISKDDLDKNISFVFIMKKNLENLKTGLECK